MKIERLRLSGFKSFVDTTELHIEPGLTGIVGPNGCGKSNVLESLRWVMGATSAKALRGKGMEDVIFSGTSGRPARNMAEVVLKLDNSERQAPSAFNDSDTIEVTRRIERDAGSAYKINGKDVRQRDVQLLFADASTGSNSPALVRQGQISELINAKPENRRKLLEEAAGISGLHSRRHEAELRLRAAETNMTRLEDHEQTMEEQLAGLKRQSRQANRYKNLSGHIRRAEATGLHIRWIHATESVEEAAQKQSSVSEMMEERTKAAAEASTAQADAAEKLPPLRENEAKEAAAVHRLNVERENLEREEERARAQAQALQSRLEQISQDSERAKHTIADAEQVIERLGIEEKELQEKQASQEDALTEASSIVDVAQSELSEKEKSLDQLTEQLAKLRAQRNNLRQTITETERRLERQRAELLSAQNERQDLLANAQDLSRNSELAAAVTAAQEAASQAEDQAREADAARLQAIAREKETRGPAQEAERELGKLKAEAKALSKLLKVNEAGLWPPVIDVLNVEPGYETALAAALGDDVNYPMDEAAPIHWDLMEGDPVGRADLPMGARPLSAVVEGPDHLKRRLSQIGIVEQHQGKELQKQLSVGQRLVTKEGDVWRWDGLTASAEAETAAATRLSQKNRLLELDGEIEEQSKTLAELQGIYETAYRESANRTQEEEQARSAWRNAQMALSEARDEQSALEKASADTKSRLASLEEAEKRLSESIAEYEQRKITAEQSFSELEDADAVENKLNSLREQVNEGRQKLSEARAAFEGLKREAAIREDRLRAISNERGEWQSRVDRAGQHITELEARQTETSAELEEVQKIPAEIEAKRITLMESIAEAEKKRNEAADALAKAEALLKKCDNTLRERQEALSTVREDRARIEAQLESAKERVNEVIDRVKETLECTPDDLLEKAELKEGAELPTLEQIETKLERLKRERENMGAVNLRAEEEATEIRERLDEMVSEREDLEAAIAKLRKGINDLNREGRERLLEAFTTVNENFARLFTVLFNGGEARLELTESDDPLAAGLEIFARPPGKRLQNMALMSGGEQALTAVALIFAVFIANPAPICFLDEVDAPLDDANIERFCDLLDEMISSTDTRFIVITHHALTMSRMNRLYGVTMAERGISQLVSVDLSGAEQLREAG